MTGKRLGAVLAIGFVLHTGVVGEIRANDVLSGFAVTPTDLTTFPVRDGAGQRTGLPWANGRFVYEFSPLLAQDDHKTALFESVCRSLLEHTALRCTRRSEPEAINDPDYVYVVDGFGDFSHVGRQGGKQILGILNWANPVIVAHEIKHALGWGHEQQHPDRDRYVDVLFKNIPEDRHENFLIYDAGNEGPYDFDSIMHFTSSDFALPTRKSIRVRSKYQEFQRLIGQRDHLSAIDLQEIQQFYGDPSVEWCGISRKSQGSSVMDDSAARCSLVCELSSDPGIGTWVPGSDCQLNQQLR